MRTFKQALENFVNANIEHFNQYLNPYNLSLVSVLPFEPDVLDVSQFPCLALGDVQRNTQWDEAHYRLREVYTCRVVGYIIYDDNQYNARAIESFEESFKRLFELRSSQTIDIPGELCKLEFEEFNVPESSLDYQVVGDNLTRIFVSTFRTAMYRPANIYPPSLEDYPF
jgi:hypothetical protein